MSPTLYWFLFSENQTDKNGESYNEILYVQKRNARAEQWNGKRLGVEGAIGELGFSKAMNAIDFYHYEYRF